MKRIKQFSLRRHDGSREEWPTRSNLLVNGQSTSTKIPGYELLQQFEIPAGYLLVTDYDCPFEETVNLILLNRNLRILSCQSIGSSFAFAPRGNSYLLKDIEWLDDWHFLTIPFDEQEKRYNVTIRTWSIPFIYPRLSMRE